MGNIKAVPQTYRGVRFRSTLEADWAANLDALDIAWQYEPEAVTLPSGQRYRPDFYLPGCETWLEIKGPHDERIEKTRELAAAVAHYPHCVGHSTEREVAILLWPEDDREHLTRTLADASPGDTTIKIREVAWTDESQQHVTVLRSHTVRRAITLTNDVATALRKIRPTLPVTCCDGPGFGPPWRLVVTGRAPDHGTLTWESPNDVELWLIQCSECDQRSFFDHTGAWTCRCCHASGKVYRRAHWVSGERKFIRFARNRVA